MENKSEERNKMEKEKSLSIRERYHQALNSFAEGLGYKPGEFRHMPLVHLHSEMLDAAAREMYEAGFRAALTSGDVSQEDLESALRDYSPTTHWEEVARYIGHIPFDKLGKKNNY